MKVECTRSLNNLYLNFHWKLVKINGQKNIEQITKKYMNIISEALRVLFL